LKGRKVTRIKEGVPSLPEASWSGRGGGARKKKRRPHGQKGVEGPREGLVKK